MFTASMIIYPWDLWDEGVEKVLTHLHGEVGFTGVSLVVGAPPVVQLRSTEIEPRLTRTRGGFFFHPSSSHYESTRCKPVVSSWLRDRDPLKKIVDAPQGLTVRAIFSAAVTGRMAEKHPTMATKNVFGSSSYRSVCLANPDVQAFLYGAAADLCAQYGLDSLAISDFAISWFDAFGDEIQIGARLSDAQRTLLSLCFCESCQQKSEAAGVDVQSARRVVGVILDEALSSGRNKERRLEAILNEHEPIAQLLKWRRAELEALFVKVKDVCNCDLVQVCATPEPHALDSAVWQGQPNTKCVTSIIVEVDCAEQLPCEPVVGDGSFELRLSRRFMLEATESDLVGTLSRAVELGFLGVEIDNYGLLSKSSFNGLRQAIRFARRAM